MTQQDMTLGVGPVRPAAVARTGWWTHIALWDQRLSVAKGLTIVTILTGFLGGYFQYLSSYEDKVSAQAKADMEAATATFVEISNAFSEAQMLQELIFYNFEISLGPNNDVGDMQMIVKASNDIFPDYVKARTDLRKKDSVYAHQAEIYIDWASDLGRDPAAPRVLGLDPLSDTLLKTYDFDCNADANLPQLSAPAAAQNAPAACVVGAPPAAPAQTLNLCARTREGAINASLPPVTIDWQSAKHHVLTMHYCFEQAHQQIVTARIWASTNPVSDARAKSFRENEHDYEISLERQKLRLNAFMNLTMAHLDSIRVKYRPSGFFCHVPLVRDAIGLFSNKCTPIRMSMGS